MPIGIGGSDSPLKNIRSFVVKGRTAFELYEREIKPKLSAAGFEETLSDNEFQGTARSSPPVALTSPPERRVVLARHNDKKAPPRERADARKKKRN